MTISNNLPVTAGYAAFQFQGYAAFKDVSPTQADAAKDLLGQFGLQSGFAVASVSVTVQGFAAGGAGPYAELLQAPAGFDPQQIGPSIDMIQGKGGLMTLMAEADTWYRETLKAAEEFDRMGTSMMRDVLGLVGLQLKSLEADKTKVGGTDKFASYHLCRNGRDNPSNLNDSDHLKLALYNIMSKEGKGPYNGMKKEDLVKRLEEEYGIKAEATFVTSKEGDKLNAIKFENGATIADGAGDGLMDLRDYDYKGAIDDIKARTGITPEDFDKNKGVFKADNLKAAEIQKQVQEYQKIAKELYDKLGSDFEKRRGYPIGDSPFGQQMNWASKDSKPAWTDETSKLGQIGRGLETLFDVNMLFMQAFAFAREDPKPARTADRGPDSAQDRAAQVRADEERARLRR